jgi:hypothetical protein
MENMPFFLKVCKFKDFGSFKVRPWRDAGNLEVVMIKVKAQPLNNRLFSLLCDEMGSEYMQLLLHSEIRWLSIGKVLAKLFQLRHEVLLFVNDSASLLVGEAWLLALSYLSDIFSKLNNLNLSLREKYLAVLDAYDKIKAFEKKLVLWISYVKNRQFASFPTLE